MNKEICRRCMEVEKTASFEEDKQEGNPASWKVVDGDWVNDEKLWNDGKVFCPHKRHEVPFDKAYRRGWCLRFEVCIGELDASD